MSRALTLLILVVLAGLLGVTTWSLNRNSVDKHAKDEQAAAPQAAAKAAPGGEAQAKARMDQLKKQLDAKKQMDASAGKQVMPPKPHKAAGAGAASSSGPGAFDVTGEWFKTRQWGDAGVKQAERAAAAYEKQNARKPLRLPIPNAHTAPTESKTAVN